MKPLAGLQDIQGLDTISWWPLAPGWWLLIGLAGAMLLAYVAWFFYCQAKALNWRSRAVKDLLELDKTLTPESSQQAAIKLSSLVRRLAVHRYSREECAGLSGEAWLQWLADKDPTKFNWHESARCLIQAPFMPRGEIIDVASLRRTIRAAKGWIA